MTFQQGLHNAEAEASVIGAAMLDESVPDVVALAPEQFFSPVHQAIWRAILELRAEGRPFDPLVIAERSNAPLNKLTDSVILVPAPSNAEHYADIVRHHALTRAVLAATSDIQEMHRRNQASGPELLDALLKLATGIDVDRPRGALTIGDLLRGRFAELDEIAAARLRGEHVMTGIPTGLPRYDDLTGGVQPGIVTLVAARPAMGKSALALTLADAASAADHGVHVFSLEDARSAYADRALGRAALVPIERIRACNLQRGDMHRLTAQAAALIKRKNWLYEDVSDISADEIVRAVRRERKRNNTRMVIVDYLQLLRRPRRYENVHDAITQNIHTLARAAKADHMAYVVLCQLNRDVERRADRRPVPSDLRGSGTLEDAAKCIIGLYRGAYYGDPTEGIDYEPGERPPTEEEWQERLDLLLMKNSHGRTGLVRVRWQGDCTRVYQ